MSCHTSCLTCSSDSFSACTSCPAGIFLSKGYCLCETVTSYLCSANPPVNILAVLEFLSSFSGLFFGAVFVLYFLQIKARFTYRMVSVLQMMSFTIHCQAYFPAQTEFLQRLLYKANGGIFVTLRNEDFSISYLIPSWNTIAICLGIYLGGYWLTKAFTFRKYENYGDYLSTSAFKLFQTVYYFHSKYMFLFCGVYIANLMSSSSSIGVVHIGIVYGMLVIAYFILVFCLYQKKTLRVCFFSKTFYLYAMVASSVTIMIPLTELSYAVFLVQLGLYIIVMLIGKHQLTRKKVFFFSAEVVFICIEVTFAALTDMSQAYFGLAVLLLFLALAEAEVIYTFWIAQPSAQPTVAPSKSIFDKDQPDNTIANLNDNHRTELNGGEGDSPNSQLP